MSIADNCPHLRILTLWNWLDTTNVSDDAIVYLVKNCKELRYLALPSPTSNKLKHHTSEKPPPEPSGTET
eukprot:CAMPEP_0174266498 /NCGR_PEP_ID=MMETSP0439-20130205/30453_1 /TAXON_ID=0 /ORGANISM="Stereomyxa ramosa, Strain Chinc5" /LENGTH=69 /DNA_ID=CAMNT_0015353505 /DNA_START=652 /DNA_END=857 /DNA_ORIENTATION=+